MSINNKYKPNLHKQCGDSNLLETYTEMSGAYGNNTVSDTCPCRLCRFPNNGKRNKIEGK
jgi:hypothetical protein